MFETATRIRLRYQSTVGPLTTEQLWDLPLQSARGVSLDEVAIALHEEIEKTGKKSFVSKNKKDKVLELKMDIVKHIIEVKLNEAEIAKKAKENAERKDILMDVIAEKQVDELKGRSLKDLQKEIKSL